MMTFKKLQLVKAMIIQLVAYKPIAIDLSKQEKLDVN